MDLYLVNGFLGSGKTTAIAGACKLLIDQNIKPAVITNDQGAQQVDTLYLRGLSLTAAEVSNGCFCCRFNEFEHAFAALQKSEKPQIIFSESVGSCTDLVATVAKPFAARHADLRVVISVFADAYLAHSIMKGTSCFIEETVQYIYKKQLEEADIVVINKSDLLSKGELEYVKETFEESYDGKKIICIDAYDENDIRNWLQVLNEFYGASRRTSLELDYDVYGAGEAMLAWFDQNLSIHTMKPYAMESAMFLAENIFHQIRLAGYTIGHLKFLLSDGAWQKKLSFTTTGNTQNSGVNEHHPCKHIDVLINARVQTSPEFLQQTIHSAIEETITSNGCRIVAGRPSAFTPGYPKPVHRVTV